MLRIILFLAVVALAAAGAAWLAERGYRVVALRAADIERDLEAELKRLESA